MSRCCATVNLTAVGRLRPVTAILRRRQSERPLLSALSRSLGAERPRFIGPLRPGPVGRLSVSGRPNGVVGARATGCSSDAALCGGRRPYSVSPVGLLLWEPTRTRSSSHREKRRSCPWHRITRRLFRLLATPRMWLAGVMGFSSGLPILLSITVLQAWLIAEEIDLATIGLLGLVALPYNLKFIWAPVIDRFDPLGLGRRKSWLAITQVCIAISLLILGTRDPHRPCGPS